MEEYAVDVKMTSKNSELSRLMTYDCDYGRRRLCCLERGGKEE
jgi:hypothetical protein